MGVHSKIGVDVRDTEIEAALGWGEIELKGLSISREENTSSVCVCVYIYIYL